MLGRIWFRIVVFFLVLSARLLIGHDRLADGDLKTKIHFIFYLMFFCLFYQWLAPILTD